MYHYVREFEPEYPFFRFLHRDSFALQLDWLSENYGMATKGSWKKAIEGNVNTDENVVLTFDDGLKDHVKYVLPELSSRNMWGMFYICSAPYISGRILDVHKVHLILGRLGENAFSVLKKTVKTEMLNEEGKQAFSKGPYATQNNSKSVDQFKRYLNYYISYEYRGEVLEQLMEEVFGCNDIDIIKELYLSIDDIRKLHKSGMIIGSHTETHRVLSRLSVEEQVEEINNSQEFLEDILGVKPTTFCYPYGGEHTFTDDTQNVLNDAGFELAFSVEPRDCTSNDFSRLPLKLPRFDCNIFPHGQLHIEPDA